MARADLVYPVLQQRQKKKVLVNSLEKNGKRQKTVDCLRMGKSQKRRGLALKAFASPTTSLNESLYWVKQEPAKKRENTAPQTLGKQTLSHQFIDLSSEEQALHSLVQPSYLETV